MPDPTQALVARVRDALAGIRPMYDASPFASYYANSHGREYLGDRARGATIGDLRALLALVDAREGEDLDAALAGLTDLTLTQGDPTFGIECTAAIGDVYETVVNQPSPREAIINARKAVDAARTGGSDVR